MESSGLRWIAAVASLGSTVACGEASPAETLTEQTLTSARPCDGGSEHRHEPTLPVDEIEELVGAKGTVTNGVLDIPIARTDIGSVEGPEGVTFTPSFEIHGDLYFQPLADGRALLNGDLALLPEEVNPFVSALLEHQLVFQAYHQHVIEMSPQIWFNHFRGVGDALVLAREIRAAIAVTRTPLPQPPPRNASTPLDPERLASILHGDTRVGDDGVVTVTVDRTDRVFIDRVLVRPETGISTIIEFKPLGGASAAVVPDFSMTSSETVPVVNAMLNALGWFQGCLYNQETDEHPQLYFDHMVKTGNAYRLAAEIRKGLNLTNAE